MRREAWLIVAAAVLAAGGTTVQTQRPGPRRESREALLVSCPRPCTALRATAERLGGRVTRRFDNVDAVAVQEPLSGLPARVAAAGPGNVKKDARITRPRRRVLDIAHDRAGRPGGGSTAGAARAARFDSLGGARALHAQGLRGQGTVIAVIDDGIAMDPLMDLRSDPTLVGGFATAVSGVAALRPVLGNRLIGGESFVDPAVDPTAATRFANDAHGTVIAGLAAGDSALVGRDSEPFIQSMRAHLPDAVSPCVGPPYASPCGPNASVVSLTGTAPAARLYALKAFPSDGAGYGQTSDLMAALDRAITLRRNFNRGVPSVPVSGSGTPDDPYVYDSLRVDVVNMSFGGLTPFAGRDAFDLLLFDALDAGIVPVVAAMNDGPVAMSTGSPGTSFAALTVGAIDAPGHSRVWHDIDDGLGAGLLRRPSGLVQAAQFSSRGPTADGRLDPDVAALGSANLHIAPYAVTSSGTIDFCNWFDARPGTCQATVALSAGTSYATPIVAGAAALLRQAMPTATATQIRNALHFAANPAVFGDGSGPIDRGAGALDVPAALRLLRSGRVSRQVPDLDRDAGRATEDPADALGRGGRSVFRNVQDAGFQPITFTDDAYVQRITNLLPGQVAQVFIPSDLATSRLTVELSDLSSTAPSGGPTNDAAHVQLVDAPTGWRLEWEHAWERVPIGFTGWSRTIERPQTGLVRLAVQGNTGNSGRLSATVTIRRERTQPSAPSAAGRIRQDDFLPFDFDVPAGTRRLEVEATWRQNWSRYPANDLDMQVVDPAGNVLTDGITWNSPERLTVDDPLPGTWQVVVAGFTIYRADGRADVPGDPTGRVDEFALRATVDGRRLSARRPPSSR